MAFETSSAELLLHVLIIMVLSNIIALPTFVLDT